MTEVDLKANEAQVVKRLDGEVVIEGDRPFDKGTYSEVWVGHRRGGGTVEKVCLSLSTLILLIYGPLQVALKALRPSKGRERARKVRSLRTIPILLARPSLPRR